MKKLTNFVQDNSFELWAVFMSVVVIGYSAVMVMMVLK